MKVIGARGKISDANSAIEKVSQMEAVHDSTIQLFRADRIFGREHIETALELANRARDNDDARAKTLGMEVLLFAAAERQITGALEKLGVGPETCDFGVLIVGDASSQEVLEGLNLMRDDAVLDKEGKDHSIFNITQEEMMAAPVHELILERMALSQLNR